MTEKTIQRRIGVSTVKKTEVRREETIGPGIGVSTIKKTEVGREKKRLAQESMCEW